ncbi:nucleotide exchange factor GrpE [Anaerovorax odorimutans]|uniref:nucleotide exchange factor GrpE n=1 Tax=Anaerovorax odorimutans TaxID=109327 RepID=UPI0003F9323A|nr:nucleotide exchange factor GrpE [Anaerovorax odorimutans]
MNKKKDVENEIDIEDIDSKTEETPKKESDNKSQSEEVNKESKENKKTGKKEESKKDKKVEENAMSSEDEEGNTKYLRLAADFQNYKRRVEKEKSDIYAFANEKIVLELLNVIDNFERALDHKSEENESFTEGMGKIFKQLKGVLEKSGVEEINAKGEDFDPNFHHAVLTESSDEHESGKVILVLQKGYTLNNKVIRPAMVKVSE